jgi:hypothetical protein
LARARNIKPGLFKNEILGVADPLYTLLFEGLWLLADREGRLEDRPLRIKAETFPYRDGLDVSSMLGWLQANGFIRRYRVGGLAYIEVCEFVKHQNPHKNEPDSVIPSSEEADSPSEFIGSARADSLSLDSGFLIADTATPDKPPSPPAPRRPKAVKTVMPADFGVSEKVRTWAAKKGFVRLDEHLEAFKRKAAAKAYVYADWDSAFMEAVREDWAKLRGRAANGAPAAGETATAQSAEAARTAEYLAERQREDALKRTPENEAARIAAMERLGRRLQ